MFQEKHIDRQAEKLADVQDETHVNRLKDLEAETLVPMLFNTLAEVQENHLATLLTKWRSRQLSKRYIIRDVVGKILVDFVADTVAEVELEKLGNSAGDVQTSAVVEMHDDKFASGGR